MKVTSVIKVDEIYLDITKDEGGALANEFDGIDNDFSGG
jgi:hypothetical protein